MKTTKELTESKTSLISQQQVTWQGRDEWFFNREYTDRYEDYYEGPYKEAERDQKSVLEQLIKADERVEDILEFGCGTTRFTRWWPDIGLESTGGDISPFMLSQALYRFDGDLVMADSHHLPFKDQSYDAVGFITTFEYYKDPVQVLQEAARVAKYGIIMGMMNRNTPKIIRRRAQQAVGKNQYYNTATFYTPRTLRKIIDKALQGRKYTLKWHCTGLPKWFPIKKWDVPVGDFFGMYIQFTDR
ncbi:MAG: methyltransferase domain-containing protein [Fibrobacter sp.]|nr:methyltransferase domain-containing protein [Fibrobacter sp.]